MSNVEKLWQDLKTWADAANANKMPSHHVDLEVFLQKLLAENAIDPLQYSRAFTAITYAEHCTTPLLAEIERLTKELIEIRPTHEKHRVNRAELTQLVAVKDREIEQLKAKVAELEKDRERDA